MVDILGIINELPHNPTEALIELDWRLSKMAHLFPKPHKKSYIISLCYWIIKKAI